MPKSISLRKAFMACAVLAVCAAQQPVMANPLANLYKSRLVDAANMAESVASALKNQSAEDVIRLTQQRVAYELRDPDSAKFREVALVESQGGTVVCGQVNGTNAYGGYVGFKSFIGSPDLVHIIDDLSGASNVTDSVGYRRYCIPNANR
ncbi:hypothetical protein [Comamonas testosteroni]|uniref:hypothetical protein n=1 Tax=Comamonas testosteroni TaxID=285 RepID=UPI0006A64A4C|nr:hypothetical protein [Comamonas testosteroni]